MPRSRSNAGAHVRQNRVVASGIFQHFTCLCSVHLNAAVCPMFCIVVVALLLLRGVVQLLPQLESSDMNATLNLHQQALSYDLLVSKEYKIWLDGALF